MTFNIESKFEIGDKVKLNNQNTANILNAELKIFDNYYRIMYLLEYENQERRWIEESQISEKVETE